MKRDTKMDDTMHSAATAGGSKKKKKEKKPMASMSETLGFVFDCGGSVRLLFGAGFLAGILNGLVFPALAYLFSNSFADISGAAFNGLESIKDLAFTFMGVGAYALLVGTVQSWAFEIVAFYSCQNFRLKWFRALLRQDPAFFDVYDVGGIANQVGSNANKFRRGVGRKFGEGIQFLTTGIGGLAYAFYADWRVALVVLSVVPLASLATLYLMNLNQTKGSRSAQSYKKAGSVAYSAVSAIKTVLSLNAIQDMVDQYMAATEEAFRSSLKFLLKFGFAHGATMGSFLFLYAILTMYGTSILYKDIRGTGCDPSASVDGNTTCSSTGADVFGAMLGVAFAAQGISQVGNFTEAFAAARVAAYEALIAISRRPGAEKEIIYKEAVDDDIGSSSHSKKSKGEESDVELAAGVKEVKAVLPEFTIDSASNSGLKPEIKGAISVRNVHFTYPTRPDDPILQGMSLDIEAGTIVAFVGPSGGGKSTIISLMERFYDPTAGEILLDGVALKKINVTHLRRSIGYVGQEPTLFATSIRNNIKYGNPQATQEQIEEAARLANAHDFITAFSDGYDTQVGDMGSQLSGGQKQRIVLARVLVSDPKLLLLDEATSALDAESELIVQDAIENILEQKKLTAIVIAHRLSTIRNADKINVILGGQVKESGTHDELMAYNSYYRRLVEKQEGGDDENQSSRGPSRRGSELDLTSLDQGSTLNMALDATPHIEFRNVSFSYPSRPKKLIFDDFNLSIRQGETVALVGPSGGGKSTTVGLIERFYDPSQGQILYLGHDLRSLNVSWYRSQLSYVGQEPTLFDMSIADNIAFGASGVTRAGIEAAAEQANAHDFIVGFSEGYETPVGSRGSQLSGGQKQRIAIARALVRKPKVLILDEATSALDNESEAIVQEAIDNLMQSRSHTVIVIAHRLSTIRNADRIAMIDEGKVVEFGSHEELTKKPNGRYSRLFESSKRRSTVDSMGLRRSSTFAPKAKTDDEEQEEDEEIDWEALIKKEEEKSFSVKRARAMASPDVCYMLIGTIGAVMAGGVYPVWGIMFSSTIDLLFRRVLRCPQADGSIPDDFLSCDAYWQGTASTMRQESFAVAGYWVLLCAVCLGGNVVTQYGFGTASERLNKRTRDTSFMALMRQEVAFFDKRSVGSITSQLQDDAARIQAFSGEPIKSFVIALASVVTGVVVSLVFMWPFALVAIGTIPIMGAATSVHHKQMLGEDLGDQDAADELNSPGGIVVETLLNMRTVSALTLEKQRFRDYENALVRSEPHHRRDAFMNGLTGGLSVFVQQWINALQFYFGGWLLFTFPNKFGFSDFLISQFSVLFGLFGLGAAFQDISDRKEVEKSAGRIFYLLDRKSEIDPLDTEGKKLN